MPPTDNAQERITGFWSTVASDYEAHPGNTVPVGSEAYADWVDVLREVLPPAPADVLDVATGTGFVAFIAAGLRHRVTAIDLAPGMLEVSRQEARRRELDVRVLEGDAVEPPFSAGSFDALTSRHLLWTLREPDRAFANWFRVMRPGGTLVAIDGCWFRENPTREESEADGGGGMFEQFYTTGTVAALPLMRLTDPAEIVRRVAEAGFVDVSTAELRNAQELGEEENGAPYVLTAQRP